MDEESSGLRSSILQWNNTRFAQRHGGPVKIHPILTKRPGERFETRVVRSSESCDVDHERQLISPAAQHIDRMLGQFYEAMVKSAPLGRRNGLAELLVRVSKDCRDLLRVAILDLCALQHEDKFAVAQQANRWRRRLIPGEVVASAIGGFDVRAGKDGGHAVRPYRMLQGQRNAWSRFARGASTDGIDDDHQGA